MIRSKNKFGSLNTASGLITTLYSVTCAYLFLSLTKAFCIYLAENLDFNKDFLAL